MAKLLDSHNGISPRWGGGEMRELELQNEIIIRVAADEPFWE
jgi:hypothetical protein